VAGERSSLSPQWRHTSFPRAFQDAAPDLVEQEDVDPGTGQAKHPQARYRAQVQRIQDEGNQVQARKRRYFGIPLKGG